MVSLGEGKSTRGEEGFGPMKFEILKLVELLDIPFFYQYHITD